MCQRTPTLPITSPTLNYTLVKLRLVKVNKVRSHLSQAFSAELHNSVDFRHIYEHCLNCGLYRKPHKCVHVFSCASKYEENVGVSSYLTKINELNDIELRCDIVSYNFTRVRR